MLSPAKVFCARLWQAVARRRAEAIKETCAVIFILGLTTAMLFPAVRGDWPVGHDHTVHIFRIWQLEQNIRLHGTPWAWTNRWFTGCPTAVVYPVGADFFVLAVRAFSLGKLAIHQAYGVAFWLFYFLYGYAVFYFTRHAFGSRAAGIIAAILLLSDPGNNEVGGWFWIVDAGVWTAALGMVPALIGLIQMAALLQTPTPTRAAAVAICLGLGLLCHPLIALFFAIAFALLCACRFVTGERTPWRAAAVWVGIAFGCGLLIASFWLVPHLAARPYIASLGAPGLRLEEIGTRISGGTLFPRMWWLAIGFGFVGSLWLVLTARRSLPLFAGSFVFLCVTLTSSTFVEWFGPAVTSWANQRMIFLRLLMLLKPFWYAAGAFLLVSSAQNVNRSLRTAEQHSTLSRPKGWHRVIASVAAFIFLGVFVAPVLFYSLKSYLHDEVLRPTQWHSQRTDLTDRAIFVAWANMQPRTQFFRICHGFGEDEHSLTDLGMEIPQPLYKNWDTPTGDHFKYDINASSNAALRAVNVRYIIAEHPLERPDFIPEQIFGRLRLYAFRDWNPQPFVVQGKGEVQLEQFSDESITLRALPGCSGLLRVNVTYFPKWRVTHDGAALPITAAPVSDVEKSAFLEVPLSPGVYRFRYKRDVTDYLGTLLCAGGVAASIVLASWQTVPAPARLRA